MSNLYSVGVIPNNIPKGNYTTKQGKVQPTKFYGNAYAYCDNITNPAFEAPVPDINTCTQNVLDIGAFYNYFNTFCLNKKICSINPTSYLINSTTTYP